MSSAEKLPTYTIDDIYALPEGKRAELIDGQMYMMATPGRAHQEIVHFLDKTIGNYIDIKNGGCKVYPAPFAVYPFADESMYVEPDISVICDKNKLDDKGCNGAPDWIVEVVSPGNPRHDYIRKLNLYLDAGVREYWIVDKERNHITVYDFEKNSTDFYSFSDTVKAGIYDDLKIDFSKIEF